MQADVIVEQQKILLLGDSNMKRVNKTLADNFHFKGDYFKTHDILRVMEGADNELLRLAENHSRVVVSFGVNDIRNEVPVTTILENLKKMAYLLSSWGLSVTMIIPCLINIREPLINAAMDELIGKLDDLMHINTWPCQFLNWNREKESRY